MVANNVGPLLLLNVFIDKTINREVSDGQLLLQRSFCFLLYPHQLVPNGHNNSSQIVLETQHFYFLYSVVLQHDTEACSMHRKLPKTPKLLLKQTDSLGRNNSGWSTACFWSSCPEEQEKIRPNRSHPSILCFYSLMKHGKTKFPWLLAVLSHHLVSQGAGRSGVVRPGRHITLHPLCFSHSSRAHCCWRWDSRCARSPLLPKPPFPSWAFPSRLTWTRPAFRALLSDLCQDLEEGRGACYVTSARLAS